MNIFGVTYDYSTKKIIKNTDDEQPVYPSIGINAQKQVVEFKNYALAIGGQILFPSKLKDFQYYMYLNNKYELEKAKFIAGLYVGNHQYFGDEPRFSNGLKDIGVQLGIEYEIIEKLFFQADFMSGKTPLSNLIIGGAYKLNKNIILSSGFQIPNTKNTSSNGVIFEFTYVQ